MPSVDFANHGDRPPVGNDATFVFPPHHLYVAKVLARFGHLPGWDCTGFGGRPIVGNPQGRTLLSSGLDRLVHPYASTLGWLTVVHLLWGGLGVYVLARKLRA